MANKDFQKQCVVENVISTTVDNGTDFTAVFACLLIVSRTTVTGKIIDDFFYRIWRKVGLDY